jgi:hypothetical protein
LKKRSGPDNELLKTALRATGLQKVCPFPRGAEVKQPVWKGDFI